MLGKHPAILFGLLIAFAAVGFLVFTAPVAAFGLVGLAILGLFVARPPLARLLVVALVLVPTIGFLRSSGRTTAATQLAGAIESGSLQNRVAATLLFCAGLAFVFMARHQLRKINLLPWIGMFLALAFTSTLWSQSMALTLRRATEALFITVFALGVGSFYYGRKLRGNIELIRTISLTSSALILAVLVLSILHGDFHIGNPAWRLGREGIENQIGWVSALGFLVTWATRKREDIWPAHWLVQLNLFIPGVGVLLTKSRETWLGVFAALFFLELLKPISTKKRITAVLALLAVLAAFAVIPALRQMWFRGSSDEDLLTASGRTELWAAAWPSIQNRILLGHGFGAFWTGKRVLAFSTHWSPTSLHNGYLDTAAEIGIVGLLLIALGVGFSAWNAWKLMKYPKESEIALGLLAVYVCFLVINGFGGVLEVFNYFHVTAILVYSFYVSYRVQALTAFRPRGVTANIFLESAARVN